MVYRDIGEEMLQHAFEGVLIFNFEQTIQYYNCMLIYNYIYLI